MDCMEGVQISNGVAKYVTPFENHTPSCAMLMTNLPQGVYGFHLEQPHYNLVSCMIFS